MSSGGASARVIRASSTIVLTVGAIACRISSSSTLTSTVFPVASSRPITFAARPVGEGNADPIATFSSSADFSPIDTPYVGPDVFLDGGVEVETADVRRATGHHAAHRDHGHLGSVPRRCRRSGSRAARARGGWHRPRPRAAPPPAPPAARRRSGSRARSRDARRWSTRGGTQTSTRGFGNRVTPTRRRTTASIRCVTSNSVIVPSRSGRTASTLPESPPSICQASSPIATTSPLPPCSATTVGSSKTMPSPCR